MARNLIWSQRELPGVTSASKCELTTLRRGAHFTVEIAPYDLPIRSRSSRPQNRSSTNKAPRFGFIQLHPELNQTLRYIKEPNHTLWTIHLSLPLRTLLPLGWWTSGIPVRRRQEIHWVLALPRAVRTQLWLLLPLPLGQEAQGAERCRPH